jgi:large subunit ribosomal protein L17
MRHGKRVAKLGKPADHRKAMLKNLCNELFRYKRIQTTLPKAKATQSMAERLLMYAKKGDLAARRVLITRLGSKRLHTTKTTDKKDLHKTIIQELIDVIGPAMKDLDTKRKTENPNYTGGGYTRVIKIGQRQGDAAMLALLEICGFENVQIEKLNAAMKEKEDRKKRKKTLAERIKAKKEEMQKKD